MRFNLPGFIFLVCSFSALGQLPFDSLGWIPPVDIPIYLSGNFAELRTGHFHAGIDIKTQGKEGFKVYAVQNGYISRIKVSSQGYGKAIYIDHPDGYTSVYGHLSEYNIQLEKYVKAVQYTQHSYEVDIFPERGELPVSKGDIIALSGNTGSSAGPHVHFEIRDTRNSRPMNGLFLNFGINDNIPPIMEYLYVYPQNSSSFVNNKNNTHFYSLKKLNGNYLLRQGDTLLAIGEIGFGLKVNDYLNGSANRCGVYELKAFIDDSLFYHAKFDGFSFNETRYINSLMDYEENEARKRKLHKLYVEPNNHLSIYLKTLNRGIVNIKAKNELHKIRIEAFDTKFNKSGLIFYLKGDKAPKNIMADTNYDFMIPWQDDFNLDTMGLTLKFEKASFYDTLKMKFSIDTSRYAGAYSNIYNIHNSTTPVHKYFEIAMQYDSVSDALKNKLLLGIWNRDKFLPAGGIERNGVITGMVRDLGSYCVLLDTIKPEIIPVGNLTNTNDLSHISKIQFKIKDNFSGIASYNGTINNNWVLFEYDAKNDLISYSIDENMPKEGDINLKIEVIDSRGNVALFEERYEVYPDQDYDIGQ